MLNTFGSSDHPMHLYLPRPAPRSCRPRYRALKVTLPLGLATFSVSTRTAAIRGEAMRTYPSGPRGVGRGGVWWGGEGSGASQFVVSGRTCRTLCCCEGRVAPRLRPQQRQHRVGSGERSHPRNDQRGRGTGEGGRERRRQSHTSHSKLPMVVMLMTSLLL